MNSRLRYGLMAIAVALLVAVFVDMARSVTQPGSALPTGDVGGAVYGGGQWSLAEHRGKRPVLLSFFATWCGPCRMEYPHLLELQKKLGSEGVEIVLLTQEDSTDLDRDPDYSKSPLKIITGADDMFEAFKVNGIPRTILVDKQGEVKLDLEGYNEAGMKQIEELLAKQ